jgi:spore coat polysaccharide biosynthesis protein SpsF
MKTVAIIQARYGSTRLRGKVLHEILGKPMLYHIVERAQRAETVDEVIVATTEEPEAIAIAELCRENGWSCFRGSETDVLDRYYQAAKAYQAEIIVRLTGDNPLVDAEIIDRHVRHLQTNWGQADFATGSIKRTYPLGLGVEVLPFDILARINRMSLEPRQREHVTAFIYDFPELFLIEDVIHEEDLSAFRLTVDTDEDFKLARQIYEHFGHNRFSWHEAVAVLRQNKEWQDINRHIVQKTA